jgi:SAM-dependent methyltransferase
MGAKDRTHWDERYRAHGGPAEPSAFLVELDGLLPRHGRALDVAGGAGRNGLWLARRGLDVTVVDISPVALALAGQRAAQEGLEVGLVTADLEGQGLRPGPWDVVTWFHYLDRRLLGEVGGVLAGGGWLVVECATRLNLLRHARPGPLHVLEPGELPGLVPGLVVVSHQEGWFDNHHDARLVARRPG